MNEMREVNGDDLAKVEGGYATGNLGFHHIIAPIHGHQPGHGHHHGHGPHKPLPSPWDPNGQWGDHRIVPL